MKNKWEMSEAYQGISRYGARNSPACSKIVRHTLQDFLDTITPAHEKLENVALGFVQIQNAKDYRKFLEVVHQLEKNAGRAHRLFQRYCVAMGQQPKEEVREVYLQIKSKHQSASQLGQDALGAMLDANPHLKAQVRQSEAQTPGSQTQSQGYAGETSGASQPHHVHEGYQQATTQSNYQDGSQVQHHQTQPQTFVGQSVPSQATTKQPTLSQEEQGKIYAEIQEQNQEIDRRLEDLSAKLERISSTQESYNQDNHPQNAQGFSTNEQDKQVYDQIVRGNLVLGKQLQDLHQRLDKALAESRDAISNKELQDHVYGLRKGIDEIQKLYGLLQKAEPRLRRAIGVAKGFVARKKALTQREQVVDQQTEELQRSRVQLSQDNADYTKKARELAEKTAHVGDTILLLEQRIANINQIEDELNQGLKLYQSKKAELDQREQDLARREQEFSQASFDFSARYTQLEQTLAQLEQQASIDPKTTQEYEKLLKENKELKAEYQKLKQTSAGLKQERDVLRLQVEDFNSQQKEDITQNPLYRHLLSELEGAKQLSERERDRADGVQNEFDAYKHSQEKERIARTREIESLKQKLEAADGLESQLQAWRDFAKYIGVQTVGDAKEVYDTLMANQGQVNIVYTALGVDNANDAKTAVQDLSARVQTAEQEVTTASQTSSQKDADLDELRRERKDLAQRLQVAEADIAKLRDEIALGIRGDEERIKLQYSGQIDQLTSERDQAKQRLAELEKRIRESSRKVTESSANLSNVRKMLEMEDRIGELETEVERLREYEIALDEADEQSRRMTQRFSPLEDQA